MQNNFDIRYFAHSWVSDWNHGNAHFLRGLVRALLKAGGLPMTLALTSTAFQEGANIAGQYTGDGRNISPPLKWQNPPAGTRSLAIICEDPDAPRGLSKVTVTR